MHEPDNFWVGEFGDEYTNRNRVDWRARIPFWKDVIDSTGARGVFEVGCNAGWNLSAIRRAFPDVRVMGNDLNHEAVVRAWSAGLTDVLHSSLLRVAELTFTVGVLIHVPPEGLKFTMQSIISYSTDYVLAVEYASDVEVMVPYRGHENRLWKRPFGEMYESMGLTLVHSWNAGSGFDNCMAWLLRK